MFRTQGRSGKQRKQITVTTNQKDKPRLVFNLHGTVVSEVQVEPRVVSFGEVSKGKKVSKEFTVKVKDPDKIHLESVTVDDKRFKVRKLERGKGTVKYEVSFQADKVDRYAAKVEIRLQGAKVDVFTVPLRATVVGDLRHAGSLYFIKRGEHFSARDFTISSRSDKKVHIRKVVDQQGLLKFEIVENDQPTVKIRATVADETQSYLRARRGKILIHTNSADEPVVKVLYTIAERNRQPRRQLDKIKLPTDISAVRRPPPVQPKDSSKAGSQGSQTGSGESKEE